ncbi:hypothetical protein ACTZWW_10505 [Salinarimonas sp. NSM]|uniref:hypothetical protein n=1 Tax=Salinarimonas sp. NSM TaxID=3458003 RepID=UPI0040367634
MSEIVEDGRGRHAGDELTFLDLLRILLRRWPWIVATALLVTVAAAATARAPLVVADTTITVVPARSADPQLQGVYTSLQPEAVLKHNARATLVGAVNTAAQTGAFSGDGSPFVDIDTEGTILMRLTTAPAEAEAAAALLQASAEAFARAQQEVLERRVADIASRIESQSAAMSVYDTSQAEVLDMLRGLSEASQILVVPDLVRSRLELNETRRAVQVAITDLERAREALTPVSSGPVSTTTRMVGVSWLMSVATALLLGLVIGVVLALLVEAVARVRRVRRGA